MVTRDKKKSHAKPYPRGYVEILENQQAQYAQALQMMYRRLVEVQAWPGELLPENDGHVLTHVSCSGSRSNGDPKRLIRRIAGYPSSLGRHQDDIAVPSCQRGPRMRVPFG